MATVFERTMNSKMCCRPGYGKEGREVNLFANFYKMKFNPRITVYHYDIEIEPKCPKFLKRKLIYTFAKDNKADVFAGGLPVYDGNKNVYSSVKLPVNNDGISVEVTLPKQEDTNERKFTITIKFAAQIDLSCLEQVLKGSGYGDIPQETLVVADIVIRHFPSMRYTVAGRSMYTKPDEPYSLGDTTELWSGLYTSVRASNWGLVLNVDESHTAFYEEQPVLDFMAKHLRLNGGIKNNYSLRDPDRIALERQLRGLRVSAQHQQCKRKYRIEKLTRETTSQITFDLNGKKTSIVEYFKKQYNYQLKYPNLPCILVSPKEKNTRIPMEVCTIVAGQRCIRKLTDNETRNMIRATAKKPHIRKQGTEEKIQKMQFNKDPYLQQFGFQVDNSMVQIKGKILPPPKLGYSNKTVQPQGGVWDNRGTNFYKSVNIRNWAILMFPPQGRCNSNDVQAFCNAMIKGGQQLGMTIAQPGYVKYLRESEIESVCQEIMTKAANGAGPIDLVYCILPQGSSTCYPKIKHTFENVNFISTQCMELKNLRPPKPQTIGNILQKINTKIGGVNNIAPDMTALGLFNKPVIIMGADLSPPSQGEGNRLSVASVVGSMDRFACRYSAQLAVQEPPSESSKTHNPVIVKLQEMVKALLIKFYKCVKVKPARIVFYRDGASEGQFYHIMMYELDAIRKACMELPGDGGKPYQPLITFIVSQKRHHTRLFVQNPRDGDRSGNVPAGTVVDTGITSNQDFDFYLNSHQGIQGTNKPAKYHVLADDNKFPADMVYKLTYYLCHVYARCTRSVSYPAPAYYAHLVTERARDHLGNARYNFGSSDGSSSNNGKNGGAPRPNLTDILTDISPHDNTKNKMYWV